MERKKKKRMERKREIENERTKEGVAREVRKERKMN